MSPITIPGKTDSADVAKTSANPMAIKPVSRRSLCCCLATLLLTLDIAVPAYADDDDLRRDVPVAITRAQQFLFSQQENDGQWSVVGLNHSIGVHSIVLLSLLSSGAPPEQDNVARGIEWLRAQTNGNRPNQTYDISLAIMALVAVGDKQKDFNRVSRMARTLEVYQTKTGGWWYGDSDQSFDNSNSQYAMLGLRDAAYFGVEVDPETWKKAEQSWLRGKEGQVDGKRGSGWGYMGPGDSGSMTVAGIASLVIASMFPHRDAKIGALDCCEDLEPSLADKAIKSGERWLGSNFSVQTNPGGGRTWILYYLYGLERAGRLTGRRFFGQHDWYRKGARFLVAQQLGNGSWKGDGTGENDPVVGTALALLFLSKGMTPNLVNKLQYGVDFDADPVAADSGPWNTHRYDVRNLVDYLSTQPKWPKLMTWQTVDLRKAAVTQDIEALLQAPVQVLEGRGDLATIGPAERALLADYLEQGGFLFIVRNCSDANFEQSVQSLIADIVPDPGYSLEKLPPGHDIYRAEKLFADIPPELELYGVDFGCRTAIVYAPHDHGCRWHAWNRRVNDTYTLPVAVDIISSIQLGANVLSYATGRELYDKFNAPDAIKQDEISVRESPLPIARLRHTGGWDSAPGALRNLLKALEEFGVNASGPTPTVAATDPSLYKFPLIYTHGRRNFELSDEEIEGLKKHLENGGILFADACCGAEAFDTSFREVVKEITGQELARIPADDLLFDLPGGHNITRVRRRKPSAGAGEALGAREVTGEPFLEGIKDGDRYTVIYSKYDLSCALERQTTVSCDGYIVEDAVRIATNIVLYAIFQDVAYLPDTGETQERPRDEVHRIPGKLFQ